MKRHRERPALSAVLPTGLDQAEYLGGAQHTLSRDTGKVHYQGTTTKGRVIQSTCKSYIQINYCLGVRVHQSYKLGKQTKVVHKDYTYYDSPNIRKAPQMN